MANRVFSKARDNLLLNAVTSYTESEIFDLKTVAYRHDLTVSWSGTTPDWLSFRLYGSFDGINFDK